MEPIISTSFIPKRPVSTEPVAAPRRSGSVGLLSFVTFIIVLGTGVAFAGVYLYQNSLVSQEANAQASLTAAVNGLGSTFVTDMQRLSNRMTGVKTLVHNHVVVSPIFAALQATTLQTVQYKDFSYQFTTDAGTQAKMVQVTINGVAKNYAALALQSDAYAKAPLIQNPIFSNLTVEDKTQNVDFKLVFNVDPNALSYETFINNLPASQINTNTVPVATNAPQAPLPASTQTNTTGQ
jgi:hypothetical protein